MRSGLQMDCFTAQIFASVIPTVKATKNVSTWMEVQMFATAPQYLPLQQHRVHRAIRILIVEAGFVLEATVKVTAVEKMTACSMSLVMQLGISI